jgi:hypothetical protein
MKIYSTDGQEMMTVTALEREDSRLVIKGMIFGAMPMNAELRPAQARAALKLLTPRTIWFLLTILLRRDPAAHPG